MDDLLLTGDERLIGDCKSNFAVEFEMKDLGLMHYFLGLEVWQRDGCSFIGQGKYAVEILKRFRMEDCKPMAIPLVSKQRNIDASRSDGFDPTLYRQLIGSLMYLVNTRPDISLCSQLFQSVHGGPSKSALDGCEAHTLLHQRYSGVWIGL